MDQISKKVLRCRKGGVEGLRTSFVPSKSGVEEKKKASRREVKTRGASTSARSGDKMGGGARDILPHSKKTPTDRQKDIGKGRGSSVAGNRSGWERRRELRASGNVPSKESRRPLSKRRGVWCRQKKGAPHRKKKPART